jgi:presenilin-like A22 family membrane protease
MAFAGIAYFLLYETWMRQEVVGAGDEARRAQRILWIQRAEIALVAIFVVLAHALLDVNWAAHSSLGLAGGLVGGMVGVIAGAFAVASEFGRRRYRPA